MLKKLSDIYGNIKFDKMILKLGKLDLDANMETDIYMDMFKQYAILMAGMDHTDKYKLTDNLINQLVSKNDYGALKILLIDSKLEIFNKYENLEHLVCPIVNNPKKALIELDKVLEECNKRMAILSENNVKIIDEYNNIIKGNKANTNAMKLYNMPRILIIISEFSDFMMIAKDEFEYKIMRLTQIARFVGVSYILITNKSSPNVITGSIKSNAFCRIAFKLASEQDSEVVLDRWGAECLKDSDSLLYFAQGIVNPIRLKLEI